jgi:6-phosphogluconate dehydrogenase
MQKFQVAVVGMAVMGKNLALNIMDHHFSTLVYNRTSEVALKVVKENPGLGLAISVEDMVDQLEIPRKIIIMVKAGAPVDALLKQLEPLLQKGDIVIDAGNSYFMDTIRREKEYAEKGFHFMGMGVSGGEEGARRGPAIMPSGNKAAHTAIEPILKAISAKVDGEACTAYIGENGSGHYVKMVHNGIEYGDMELIAESYQLLRDLGKHSNDELSEIFSGYNQRSLESYLIEITSKILKTKDDLSSSSLIDKIQDTAGQKGTGLWTSKEALDLGVDISVITSAVFARLISSDRSGRIQAQKVLPLSLIETSIPKDLDQYMEKALYAAKIISYAQGFDLMKKAAQTYGWNLDYEAIAKLFRGGCIIRAKFLNQIASAFKDPHLTNLLLDPFFTHIMSDALSALREVVSLSIKAGIPTPSYTAALSYYDAFRSTSLSTNMIQAQRDYFGAHTYQRTDREGYFHFEKWGEDE